MDAFNRVHQEIRAEPETLLAEIDREAARQAPRNRIVRKPFCLTGRPEGGIPDHGGGLMPSCYECSGNVPSHILRSQPSNIVVKLGCPAQEGRPIMDIAVERLNAPRGCHPSAFRYRIYPSRRAAFGGGGLVKAS